MEKYVTSKIDGVQYRIESDESNWSNVRVAMITSESTMNWIELRITSGLRIVIERWSNDTGADREYIVDDKEEEQKVRKVINEAIALLQKIKQVESDEDQAALVGLDLADLEYDVMVLVGSVFVDMGNDPVPEAVEEALKL
jgi:SH3-like domain-containing protein